MVISLFVFFACATVPVEDAGLTPEPAVEPVPAAVETTPPPPEEEKTFDPGKISREEYDITISDVQKLIQTLNGIIRARDYNTWITHLSNSYLAEISSESFLEENTEKLYKLDQAVASRTGKNPSSVKKTILKDSRDYFTYVVVPSRTNDRVDEIEFVSQNQVIAYTVDTKGTRLILYNLENSDGEWKIAPQELYN